MIIFSLISLWQAGGKRVFWIHGCYNVSLDQRNFENNGEAFSETVYANAI